MKQLSGAKLSYKTRQEYAHSAKGVVLRFDFENKRPADKRDNKLALALYMDIFYYPSTVFPKNPRKDANLKLVGSYESCSGCKKGIFSALQSWLREGK